jgi:hypothetical protein
MIPGFNVNKKIDLKVPTQSTELVTQAIPLILKKVRTSDDLTGLFNGDDYFPPSTIFWEEYKYNSLDAATIAGNALRINIINSTDDSYGQVTSKFFLTGDFDVSTDIEVVSAVSPSSSYSYLAKLRIQPLNNTYCELNLQLPYNVGTRFFANSTVDSPVYSTSLTNTKLRIKRVGSVMTAYVWDNDRWEWDGSTSGFTFTHTFSDPVQILLRTSGDFGGTSELLYSNISVTSDDFYWPPEIPNGTGTESLDCSVVFEDLLVEDIIPYFDTSVVYASPVNGAVGATTFATLKGTAMTRASGTGSIQESTTHLGGSCLRMNGDGYYKTDVDGPAGGSFTLECMCCPDNGAANAGIFGFATAGSYYSRGCISAAASSDTSVTYQLNHQSDSGGVFKSFAISRVPGQVDHVVFQVRDGDTLELWINGIFRSDIFTGENLSGTRQLSIGVLYTGSTNRYYSGTVSNIVYTKGVAVYTTRFRKPETEMYIRVDPDYYLNRIALEDTVTENQCFIERVTWETDYAKLMVRVPKINEHGASDQFTGVDGSVPDTNLWLAGHDSVDGGSTNGTVEIRNNKLRMVVPGEVAAPMVHSIYTVDGDFTVAVDFALAYAPSPDTNWQFGLYISDSPYGESATSYIYLNRENASRGPYRAAIAPTTALGGSADISGQLRVRRVGATIYCEYYDGGWVVLLSGTNFGLGTAYIRLRTREWVAAGPTVDVSFDNFTLEADSVVYPEGFEKYGAELAFYYDKDAHDNDTVPTTVTPAEASDDFTGTSGDSPNELLWYNYLGLQGFRILSNKLNCSISASLDRNTLISHSSFLGDFSISVDWDVSAPDVHFWLARLSIKNNLDVNDQLFYIDRRYVSGLHRVTAGIFIDFIDAGSDFDAVTATSGSFKITRASDVVTISYNTGSGFVALYSSSGCYTGPVFIELKAETGASITSTTNFDNFVVNSADTILKYSPIADDFTGANGDTPSSALWTDVIHSSADGGDTSGTISVQNDSLRFDAAAISYPYIRSLFKLSGDFDVQVDFILDEVPSNDNAWAFGIVCGTAQDDPPHACENYAASAVYNTAYGPYRSFISGSTGVAGGSRDLSGTLRISRVGTTITCYYLDGASFVALTTETSYTVEDVYITLWARVWWASVTLGGSFDNFVVNYAEGITGYVGETGSFPATKVYKDQEVFVSHFATDPSGTAPQVLDSTSRAKHGTSNGTMLSGDLIDGATGKLIEFDATDDYINFGYHEDHNITDLLTVECLFSPTDDIGNPTDRYHYLIDRQQGLNDSYALAVNNAGTLQLGTFGGNIKSTVTDWEAGHEYYVAATYSSSGNVGLMYIYDTTAGTGGIETLSNDTIEAMAGATSDMLAGTGEIGDSTLHLRGAIGFERISNSVMSSTEIDVVAKSFTDSLFTASIPEILAGVLYVDLVQNYALVDKFVVDMVQEYGIGAASLVTDMVQYYGIEMLLEMVQQYGESPEMLVELLQHYTQSRYHVVDFVQDYGEASKLVVDMVQTYKMNPLLVKEFLQKYTISGGYLVKDFAQGYGIKETTSLTKDFTQPYAMLPESSSDESAAMVEIDGTEVQVNSVSQLRFTREQYVGSCNATVIKKAVYRSIPIGADVTVTAMGRTFNFVVTGKERNEAAGRYQYSVQFMSKAVLLDFPYASKVPESFVVSGKASQIVNALAALEGETVTWMLPTDPVLTESNVTAIGDSPLSVIRNIVNELGGKINSLYAGDIIAVPHYVVDSDKFDQITTPTYTFSEGDDFSSLRTAIEKKDGWNRVEVGTVLNASGHTIVPEEQEDGSFIIKVYRVPWSGVAVRLVTSELTNVSLISNGLVVEEVTDEDLEFHNGEGKLTKPCYGLVSSEYGTRTNLGTVTPEENGTVTTAISGDSLCNITYYTKYWSWTLSGTDEEAVQLSLELV